MTNSAPPLAGNAADLVEQLAGCPRDGFPGGRDYSTQFQNIQNHLNDYYHKNVTVAAAHADGGGFLTDHGPEHIQTVIQRASELLRKSPGAKLSCYEKYLLLVAIHVHDLGNFFGRAAHEVNAVKVMEELGTVLGEETPEKRAIFQIAQAHGGNIDGNKDKLSLVPVSRDVLGQDVRSRFLAALLRFADELADDKTRANRYLIKIGNIPAASEIYHKYAFALQSVKVTAETVRLDFDLTEGDVKQKFGKGDSREFLLDEIYERTMKMHRERMYCMRFLRQDININRIDVQVRVYANGFSFIEERAKIAYSLEEAGYPDEKNPTIFALCPTLQKHEYGSPLNGNAFKKFMSKKP